MTDKSQDGRPTTPLTRLSWIKDSDGAWALAIFLIGCFIYLPYLGSFPLWDPWEPHYTQVAWEMQQHGTWMNPWYRGIDNWWSKPIFMLWMLRASLGLFWDAAGNFAAHEWAARFPFALAAIAGGVLQFDWVRRIFGRTVGALAAIILMTCPQYLLVGRQVMADSPFLVAYGAAMGYITVGLFTSHEAGEGGGNGPLGSWWRRNLPFVLFWVLQAVSVLSKGFVGPTLAVLVFTGYWLATFRWQDYSELTQDRAWLRYLGTRGAAAIGVAGIAFLIAYFIPGSSREERGLYQALIGAVAAAGIGLGIFSGLPPMRHALRLLSRIRASWGIVLFFAVAAPWFVYMSVKHGWPYWNEFIYYHHLGRAAGTIDKPNGTFEYFVKQIAYGAFPWSAFSLGAVWMFLGRSSPLRSIAERRNLFVLLTVLLPYLFFSLAGTKFAHYIMPVLPPLAVLLAATLIWLGKESQPSIQLSEPLPHLGPPVASHSEPTSPWWRQLGARGDLLVFLAAALVVFGILSHDLVLDFRNFLRLFIYYYNRQTPFDYHPHIALQIIFFPLGILIGSLLLFRWITKSHLVGLSVGAVALACYLGWVTMPAMDSTYSFKPFLAAYESMAKPGEPIGQYNDWQQPVRSVIFLFQNRCVHLRTDKQATAFLKRPSRKFILVDRNRLADLRRVAKEAGMKLYVVFDGHPYGRLVSDQPNPEDTRKAAAHIVKELPPDAVHADANFGGDIRLVGWKVTPEKVHPGSKVSVSFYYECLRTMSRDWQIFIHGDGPQGGSHRIHTDHYPLDGLYPTTEWQEKEIIRDTFDINVPSDYPFDYFYLWNGWYIGNERLKLENTPINDGLNRVRGPRISVVRE